MGEMEKAMTRIFLIRHGEAEGNVYRRAHGHYNSDLTANGRRQVAALAERFRDEPVDALYTSDLRRTRLTAGAITKYHDLPMQPEPRLREIALGPWEDQPFGDLQHFEPEQMLNFNNDPDRWIVPGAETFPELQARMLSVISEIAARHEGQTVVCVSHGMAIRSLLSALLDIPSSEMFRLPHGDNTAVSLLAVEAGKMQVVYFNSNDHLSDELSTFAKQSWWKRRSGEDQNNIYFQRFDPAQEPEQYLSYYRRTWQAVHGDLSGFHGAYYLEDAISHTDACPDAIVTIHHPDGEAVGIIELDTERGRGEGIGWICLCYVEAPYRRQTLGVQLIGHAVSVFRRLGYRAIRLSVYSGNADAIRFYEEYGFHPVGETEGVHGALILMEREL